MVTGPDTSNTRRSPLCGNSPERIDVMTPSDSGSFDSSEDAKQPETVRGLGDGAYFYVKGTAEVPFLELRVGDRVMTVGVSESDLHPVSEDEAKRLERAAAELIVDRLRN